ncbi:YSIRK-type signal peptide-containing protein [Streptococcus hillyeri]|uniref:YSIRK-type signal peptide-containing protein n=1 Tax=Streptococcus hillyeri TaxID=2282420 RepID=UPI0034E1E2A1
MLKQSLMLPKFYLYIKGEDYYMYKGNVPKFTLRKLSVGIVSLGAGVALMGTTLTTTVHADEATAGTATTTSTTTEADSSETEPKTEIKTEYKLVNEKKRGRFRHQGREKSSR